MERGGAGKRGSGEGVGGGESRASLFPLGFSRDKYATAPVRTDGAVLEGVVGEEQIIDLVTHLIESSASPEDPACMHVLCHPSVRVEIRADLFPTSLPREIHRKI